MWIQIVSGRLDGAHVGSTSKCHYTSTYVDGHGIEWYLKWNEKWSKWIVHTYTPNAEEQYSTVNTCVRMMKSCSKRTIFACSIECRIDFVRQHSCSALMSLLQRRSVCLVLTYPLRWPSSSARSLPFSHSFFSSFLSLSKINITWKFQVGMFLEHSISK